jgi:hypothetical protein
MTDGLRCMNSRAQVEPSYYRRAMYAKVKIRWHATAVPTPAGARCPYMKEARRSLRHLASSTGAAEGDHVAARQPTRAAHPPVRGSLGGASP